MTPDDDAPGGPQATGDGAASRSPFLAFVASEFAGRGTPERAALARKDSAHAAVAEMGLRVPRRDLVIDDLADLTPDMLDGRHVLKPTGGWASRGVMLLERIDDDVWFDHLAARTRSFDGIRETQRKVMGSFGLTSWRWIVEEFVESTVAGRPIPFDYKFYCFRERIGMIVQIDRNAHPPRLALLGPDFAPLSIGRDYALARTSLEPGRAVVPRHAAQMAQWARLLSLRTDSPFVSIDLYDSPGGPVFGEFTFSPGGTHRALWSYAPHLLAELDRLFALPSEATVDSFRASMPDLTNLPMPRMESYARLAAGAAAGHARAAQTLIDFHRDRARGAPGAHARELRTIARAWRRVRQANRAIGRDRAVRGWLAARGWNTGQEVPEPPEPPLY